MTAAMAAVIAFAAAFDLKFDSARAVPLYRAAAGGFDTAWADVESRTAGLAANRGRAHFLAGNLPAAISAYRDGLSLDPTDRVLRRDIETLRDRVIYPESAWRPAPPNGLVHRVGRREWFLVAVVAAATFAIGSGRRSWKISTGAGVAFLLTTFFGLKLRVEPAAAVTVPTVLRTGNANSYPPAAGHPLPAGLEVSITAERGGWKRIELANGVAGWVPESSLN